MRHLLFAVTLADGRELCVSLLSRETVCANRLDDDLGGDAGYFIYEHDLKRPYAGIEILAKAASYDAAARLVDIYAASVERRDRDVPGRRFGLKSDSASSA